MQQRRINLGFAFYSRREDNSHREAISGGSTDLVSESGKPTAASADEKKKELRRVYRKLKGVRCQLSMKLKELKKEAKETTRTFADDEPEIAAEEETLVALGDEPVCEQEAIKEKKLGAAQSEVKILLDHKRRLRKRFRKLQDEVRGK